MSVTVLQQNFIDKNRQQARFGSQATVCQALLRAIQPTECGKKPTYAQHGIE